MILIDYLKSALVLLAVTLALTGCAARGPLSWQDTSDYKERLQTQTEGGVRVSTSVLSDLEARDVYGVPLAANELPGCTHSMPASKPECLTMVHRFYYFMFVMPGIDWLCKLEGTDSDR